MESGMMARLLAALALIIASTPEDADRHLRDEVAKWGAVVRAANIKAE
jgi:hypothetical protein